MDVINKKIIDHEEPLNRDAHEAFCQEYVRLDLEDRIVNKRARRIKAYRFAYPETIGSTDAAMNTRASALLNKESVSSRISAIYETNGACVENTYIWTKEKSEELLAEMAYDEMMKPADRLKAISELNKMRGVDTPKVEDEENKGDSVDSFFDKFKGLIHG